MCTLSESRVTLNSDVLNNGNHNDEGDRGKGRNFIGWCLVWLLQTKVVEDLTMLWKITYPLVLASLLLHSKSIISMLFLGHLGDTELAAGSLSIAFANITGYSVIKGLAMGMESICSQAYGAKNWAILCQTYKKALLVLLLATIPICLLWLKAETVIVCFGQDNRVISVAKVYTVYSIPELLAQAQLHLLRNFLRAQSIMQPISISATMAMLLHFPINYFLVVHLHLGVKGVALASFFYTLNFNLGLLIYLILSKTAIRPWDRQPEMCPSRWKPLLSLMSQSLVSVCLEWWWYEIMLLLCGLLDDPQASIAAMGILIQTTGLLYVFPSSLGLSLSTLVGQELGAGQPAQAKRTTIAGLIVAVVIGLLAFSFSVSVRNLWGKMYTHEPQTLALISVALPVLGLCELGNCPQTAACGILVGSARPKLGAFINLGSFYLIGLPVAIFLTFQFKMGFTGLWFGLSAAQASCVCMMMYTLFCTDWPHQAMRARKLIRTVDDNINDLETNFLG